MAAGIVSSGGEVLTGATVTAILRDGLRVRAVMAEGLGPIEGRSFLISAPLTELVEMMQPPAPPEVLAACRALRYRNHIGVNLLIEGQPFPDNWIYVHSKSVRMARISNYANFSPALAPRPGISPLTVEYFVFRGERLWDSDDINLIALATRELDTMGVATRDRMQSGFVVRSEKAYPVIELGYENHIAVIKDWLGTLTNLLPIGRSGMFKYNNQDHAMATGLLATRTSLGLGRFDPWLVNIDAEYHEAKP
jgi:protoporphyrinogen oxidase